MSNKRAAPKMACLLLTAAEEAALMHVTQSRGVFPANRSQAIRYCIAQEANRVRGSGGGKYEKVADRVRDMPGIKGESGRGAEQSRSGIATKYVPFKLPVAGREQLAAVQKSHKLTTITSAVRLCIRIESLLAGYKTPADGWV